MPTPAAGVTRAGNAGCVHGVAQLLYWALVQSHEELGALKLWVLYGVKCDKLNCPPPGQGYTGNCEEIPGAVACSLPGQGHAGNSVVVSEFVVCPLPGFGNRWRCCNSRLPCVNGVWANLLLCILPAHCGSAYPAIIRVDVPISVPCCNAVTATPSASFLDIPSACCSASRAANRDMILSALSLALQCPLDSLADQHVWVSLD